jgi:hypothetical protein
MVVNFLLVSRIYLGIIPNEQEHFGAAASVTTAMWEWLETCKLVPPGAQELHLLLLFYWWKTNALQAQCCQFLGGIEKTPSSNAMI